MIEVSGGPSGEVSRLMSVLGHEIAMKMLPEFEGDLVWGVVDGESVLMPLTAEAEISVCSPGESLDSAVVVSANIAALMVSIAVLEYAYMSFWGRKKSKTGGLVKTRKLALLAKLGELAPALNFAEIMELVA